MEIQRKCSLTSLIKRETALSSQIGNIEIALGSIDVPPGLKDAPKLRLRPEVDFAEYLYNLDRIDRVYKPMLVRNRDRFTQNLDEVERQITNQLTESLVATRDLIESVKAGKINQVNLPYLRQIEEDYKAKLERLYIPAPEVSVEIEKEEEDDWNDLPPLNIHFDGEDEWPVENSPSNIPPPIIPPIFDPNATVYRPKKYDEEHQVTKEEEAVFCYVVNYLSSDSTRVFHNLLHSNEAIKNAFKRREATLIPDADGLYIYFRDGFQKIRGFIRSRSDEEREEINPRLIEAWEKIPLVKRRLKIGESKNPRRDETDEILLRKIQAILRQAEREATA